MWVPANANHHVDYLSLPSHPCRRHAPVVVVELRLALDAMGLTLLMMVSLRAVLLVLLVLLLALVQLVLQPDATSSLRRPIPFRRHLMPT